MTNFQLNLPRWIYASASKAFSDRVDNALPLFFEGVKRPAVDPPDYLEFRLDGPFISTVSPGYYKVEVEINLLVISQIDDSNLHKIYTDCGIALACFNDPIPIFQYGDGPDDNQAFIDCITITRSLDPRDAVRVSHFGKLDPSKQVMRSSVEGHYQNFMIGQ